MGTAISMNCTDFESWPRSYGTSNRCKTERPLLKDVKVVSFQRGSVEMEWNTNHDEVYFHFTPFLRQKDERLISLDCKIAFAQEEPRGIATPKKQDIIYVNCAGLWPRVVGYSG